MYVTAFFPLGAIGITLFSLYYPGVLSEYRGAIVPLLGIVMLGMGMTLRAENFLEILNRPKLILLGVSLQYLLMPFIAWSVSMMLGLPAELMIGMVLVGTCPGGTASNVICYLARGDVALSITLTTVSTLTAVVMTPVITWFYINQAVPVPVADMMLNIFRIIVLPVLAGMAINTYCGRYLHAIKHVFPLVSVVAIILIIGIIVALNRAQLPYLALPVITAVFWHNLLGLAGGWYLAGFFTRDPRVRRTLAIETGMQNSGLGVALAQAYFPPAASLPGAVFSIWHNITGSILAGYWARKTVVAERDRRLRQES
ncbi:MAG: bile acid:sodium symporter family protein [Gammaproteobacteria bacterium]